MRQGLGLTWRLRQMLLAAWIGLWLAVALASIPVAAHAQYESYGVFCASGRIEIDSRSEEQMRSNRGACQFRRFPNRSDAENFAKRNFGRIGGSCSCR